MNVEQSLDLVDSNIKKLQKETKALKRKMDDPDFGKKVKEIKRRITIEKQRLKSITKEKIQKYVKNKK